MTLLPILTPNSGSSALLHSRNVRQASSAVKSATVNSPVSSRTTPLPAVPSQGQISRYN